MEQNSTAPRPHESLEIQLELSIHGGILEIAQYPGLEPEFFLRFSKGWMLPRCNGVIIQHGAGNIATRPLFLSCPLSNVRCMT